MNYADALAWLYSAQQHGFKFGLGNTLALLAALDVDPRDLSFIHVAGTNGKGSVCAMLDAICRQADLKCGLYTSPHLVNFRERIRVDGVMIDEAEVADGLTRIRDGMPENLSPTFFEVTTVLALEFFIRQQPEIVIWETGLGGRLDATNVVTPLVSVITSIDMDHAAWLGDSLKLIAREKAGIIKANVPVVSAPQHEVVETILRDTAKVRTAPFQIAFAAPRTPIRLKGSFQKQNAAVAVAALRASKLPVPDAAISAGLSTVSWPGRFQKIRERFTLDGAHNPAAAGQLVKAWKELHGELRPRIILGLLHDKDAPAMCRILAQIGTAFDVVPVRSPRSLAPEYLARNLQAIGASVVIFDSLQTAIDANPTGIVLVVGSLFLVGEALEILTGSPPDLYRTAQ